MLCIDLSLYLWTMATPTHDFKVNTTVTAATTTATSRPQYEKGGTVYGFLHNTFFQFPSRSVLLLSPRKEIWKNRCCCCCGICEPSWLCPRSAKNKNFFFPAASSHFFPLFTNFLGVVLLVLSFVHVDGIRPLFRTTRFGWQVMWHCQPFSLRFCFHFSQICNCNEENGICCFYSTNSPLLTETMAKEWICHSFSISVYVDHKLEIFYSRPTKDLQIQALSWAWRNVVRPKTRQGSEPRRRNDDTFRVI